MCHAQATLSVSERLASRVVGQCRATQQYVPTQRADEDRLPARIIVLAHEYGRYGYRRITALLQQEGWRANHKRVERLWRQEGLKVAEETNPNWPGSGWPMAPIFAGGLSIRTMSGRMTL